MAISRGSLIRNNLQRGCTVVRLMALRRIGSEAVDSRCNCSVLRHRFSPSKNLDADVRYILPLTRGAQWVFQLRVLCKLHPALLTIHKTALSELIHTQQRKAYYTFGAPHCLEMPDRLEQNVPNSQFPLCITGKHWE